MVRRLRPSVGGKKLNLSGKASRGVAGSQALWQSAAPGVDRMST
jgi:hypothetical protein